jgi:hypothetical protein
MGGCCEPQGYDDIFGGRFSRHLAKRYRKRGLDKTAGRMVAFLAEHGVEGASVLEIGGGVGDIQIELLRRGAARATNLELVDSYEVDAPRNVVSRLMFGAQNLFFRIRRTPFRTYAHDPDAMTAAASGRLLEAYRHRGPAWHVVGFTAPTG